MNKICDQQTSIIDQQILGDNFSILNLLTFLLVSFSHLNLNIILY